MNNGSVTVILLLLTVLLICSIILPSLGRSRSQGPNSVGSNRFRINNTAFHERNPATGLPMTGASDVMGNPYGVSSTSDYRRFE
jgi:hypothetical protein